MFQAFLLEREYTKIEIWNKEEYEKAVAYDADDLAALAEDVMGDFEIE